MNSGKRDLNSIDIPALLDQHTAELAELNKQLEDTTKLLERANQLLAERERAAASAAFMSFVDAVCSQAEADKKPQHQSLSDVIQAQVNLPAPHIAAAPTVANATAQPPRLPVIPSMVRVTPGTFFAESMAERVKNKKRKTVTVDKKRRP